MKREDILNVHYNCSDVYSLCVAYPEPLADRLYNETKRFLISHVEKLLAEVQYNDKLDLLPAYHRAWTEYSQGIYYLHSLYLYLNQQHIKKQKLSEAELIYGTSSNADECQEQMEIGALGLDIWKRKMIMPLREKLVNFLLICISADRDSKYEFVPTDVICGVIQSFVRVEEYKMKGKLHVIHYCINN